PSGDGAAASPQRADSENLPDAIPPPVPREAAAKYIGIGLGAIPLYDHLRYTDANDCFDRRGPPVRLRSESVPAKTDWPGNDQSGLHRELPGSRSPQPLLPTLAPRPPGYRSYPFPGEAPPPGRRFLSAQRRPRDRSYQSPPRRCERESGLCAR